MSETLTYQECYSSGYCANYNGQAVTSNPYKAGTNEHQAWLMGWNAAQRIKNSSKIH